jgi:hypothetical protein
MPKLPCQITDAHETEPRIFLPWSLKLEPAFCSNRTPAMHCETPYKNARPDGRSHPKPSRSCPIISTQSGHFPKQTPITRGAGVSSNADLHKNTCEPTASSKTFDPQNSNAANGASGNAASGNTKFETTTNSQATQITFTSTPSNTTLHVARANTHTPPSINSLNEVSTKSNGVASKARPTSKTSKPESRVRCAHHAIQPGAHGAPYKISKDLTWGRQ